MNKQLKRFILIVVITLLSLGAIFLLMNYFLQQSFEKTDEKTDSEEVVNSQLETITLPSGEFECEALYKEIKVDLDKSNYCQLNSDCDAIVLGGMYVEFGCYHFININVDKQQFYDKMDIYNEKCNQMINKCAPTPDVSCVANKCVHIAGE